ncbi:MAG TPA: energy transducer TonB [Cyclobacteriaceae bacterium]|nr:energy transducer TonB [Cyclobacteriaceae bacterium]
MKFLAVLVLVLGALNSEAQRAPDRDQVYAKVMIESHFPGGTVAWKQFLNKNLHYPYDAISNEVQGDIHVQFQIDSSGNVSDIKALDGPKKGGLREEAIRVVRISGKWVPANQNKVNIASVRTETISFKLSKG